MYETDYRKNFPQTYFMHNVAAAAQCSLRSKKKSVRGTIFLKTFVILYYFDDIWLLKPQRPCPKRTPLLYLLLLMKMFQPQPNLIFGIDFNSL